MKVMTATYKGFYDALPQGRQWTVHSDSGADYAVTVWVDAKHGRMARCSCKASEFGLACKHIRFVQRADSYLSAAPVRDIQAVAA